MYWQVFPVLTALVPLGWLWWSHRRTPLVHSLSWAMAAWVAWLAAAQFPTPTWRYLSVALTACSGVAVLGARKPGAAAWNAVVGGLLAVFLVPLGRRFVSEAPIDEFWLWFVGILAGIGCLNYVPTYLRSVASVGFIIILAQIVYITKAPPEDQRGAVEIAGPIALWIAAVFIYRHAPSSDVTAHWLSFRDRFGALWALRVQTQFNAAARNAGHKFEMRWHGLHVAEDHTLSDREADEARRLLSSLTERFGWP